MNNKQIAISFFLIVLLGLFMSNTLSVAGFTTTGISKADFQSHDSILNGEVWVINIVQGGLSQSIYGSIAPNYQDTEGGSERTEKGVSLDITHSDQQLEYPIIIDYNTEQISKVEYMTTSLITHGETETRDACVAYAGSYGNIISVYKPPFSLKSVCVYKVPYTSRVGTFNNKILTFSTDFEMKIGDKTYAETISTRQQKSIGLPTIVKFTDSTYGDVGYVKWLGNLVTGDGGPNPAGNYKAAYFNNKWNIINDVAYGNYQSNYISNIRYGALLSESDLEREINKNNDLAVSAMNVVVFKTPNGEIATTYGKEGTGKVIVDLVTPLQYPQFVAYVSADTVKGIGVYQPVAKPKVVYVDSNVNIQTGETGYVKTTIQNIGNERGGFETSVTCTGYVSMVGTPKYNTLEAGQYVELSIPLSGQTTTSTSCTVTTTGLAESDSKTFTATVEKQVIVPIGTKICLDGKSQTYISDDDGWVFDGDDTRCIAQEEDKGFIDYPDTNLFGEEGSSAINKILIIALIAIFAIIGLLMFYGIVKAVILKKLT